MTTHLTRATVALAAASFLLCTPSAAQTPGEAVPNMRSPEDCVKQEDTTCKDALDKCVMAAVADACTTCATERKRCGEGVAPKCADEKKRLDELRARWLDWRNHLTLRADEKDQLGPATAVGDDGFAAQLHYLSISLDTVYLRNLPGLMPGSTVVIGLEIQGLLPQGRVLKTVLGTLPSTGLDGVLKGDNLLQATVPVVYPGQNLTVTLHVQSVSADEVPNIAGRLAGAGSMLLRIDPRAATAVSMAGSLFASVLGAFRSSGGTWRYAFTLYPPESIYRDKPQVVLMPGRSVFMLMPPSNAPEELKKVPGAVVGNKLKLQGNRVVYRDSGDDFTLLPYLIFNMSRSHRSFDEGTELRMLIRTMESMHQTGGHESALETLRNVAAAIAQADYLTQNEKNLEMALLPVRKAKLEAALAKQKGDSAEQGRCLKRYVAELTRVLTEFKTILLPAEMQEHTRGLKRAQRDLEP